MARIYNYFHLKFPTISIIIYFNKANERYAGKVTITCNICSNVYKLFVVK
jgi:hypothetical protein